MTVCSFPHSADTQAEGERQGQHGFGGKGGVGSVSHMVSGYQLAGTTALNTRLLRGSDFMLSEGTEAI